MAIRLKLFYEGQSTTVTSETAAKKLARKWLGARRLHETPTHDGWQYWDADHPDDEENAVTVKVL